MNLDLDMQNIRLIVPFSLSNIFDRYFMTSQINANKYFN
jgi:hypothetical protein